MKLVSLAQKYDDIAKPAGADGDEYYPSLYLDEKQMEALGIDTARVGKDMTMIATVRVSSASESKNGSRSMSFEIIEAAFQTKAADADVASLMFPQG